MTIQAKSPKQYIKDRIRFYDCFECGRIFDVTNYIDAQELGSGHDCEVE